MGFDAAYSYVPQDIKTKSAFYEHVLSNVKALLEDPQTSSNGVTLRRKQNWVGLRAHSGDFDLSKALSSEVSALSSVSAILYNSFADFEYFGSEKKVNWTGKAFHFERIFIYFSSLNSSL